MFLSKVLSSNKCQYEVKEKIGKGSYGIVYKVIKSNTIPTER